MSDLMHVAGARASRGPGSGAAGGDPGEHAPEDTDTAGRQQLMASSIFLNYRRRDSAGFAGRLADHLRTHLPDVHFFRDIEGISAGSDFTVEIGEKLQGCRVMLSLIGPHWLRELGPNGRRIDDPRDWVRRELAAAFARGVPIIPVLVGGAAMPSAAELPEELAPLAKLGAHELTEERWDQDVRQLASRLLALPGFELEQQLDALERAWEVERRRCSITDRKGNTREPTRTSMVGVIGASFVGLLVISSLAVFCVVLWPDALWELDPAAVIAMIAIAGFVGKLATRLIVPMLRERRRYRQLEQARDAHQRQRAALLAELQSRPAACARV